MGKRLFYRIQPKIDKGNYGLCPQKLPKRTIMRVLKDTWDKLTEDEKRSWICDHLYNINEFKLYYDIIEIEEL